MKDYMIIYSVGPVQTFIAQARKTRDLWQGSFLLSTLMAAAMSELADIANKSIEDVLIFPVEPIIEGNIADIPNKYTALFDTLEQAKQAAKSSTHNVEVQWKNISRSVWQKTIAKARMTTSETQAIWDKQTNPQTLFDIFWVITKKGNREYPEWLKDSQKLFDARKRLRNFLTQNEPGEKSTISGEREALRGSGQSRANLKSFWFNVGNDAHLSAKDIDLEGAERLDAIDTVKRFAELISGQPFPSTSSIATASYVRALIETLKQGKIKTTIVEQWLAATEKLDEMPIDAIPYLKEQAADQPFLKRIVSRDGDCFFDETFTSYRLQKDYHKTSEEAEEISEVGKVALKKLIQATKEQKIPTPTPYYSIIQMDGDNMGFCLNGVENEQEHKAISEALSEFSRHPNQVRRIVQTDHPGRLVYAGGDDVLALSPLQGSLDVAYKLQERYRGKVEPVVRTEERRQKVTASMGIAIAHHYTPLNLVLQTVRNAEKLAKNRYGRNALVVTVMKRSGGQICVGCRWQYSGVQVTNNIIKPLEIFEQFRKLIENDILSPKCVYTLLVEAPTLAGLDIRAQQSEIQRVLNRQSNKDKSEDPLYKKIDTLPQQLVNLGIAMDKVTNEKKDVEKSVYLEEDKVHYGLVEVGLMRSKKEKGKKTKSLFSGRMF